MHVNVTHSQSVPSLSFRVKLFHNIDGTLMMAETTKDNHHLITTYKIKAIVKKKKEKKREPIQLKLAPGRCGSNFESIIFKLIVQSSRLGSHFEVAPRRMTGNFPYEKSSLVKVMAWCRQAKSHYLSQG